MRSGTNFEFLFADCPSCLEMKDKLLDLGGVGPLKRKIREARSKLVRVNQRRWQVPQAHDRLWRFIKLRQRPYVEELEDVREAHAKYHCLQQIEANLSANDHLAQQLVDFIARAERVDAEFFSSHIEVARERILRLRERLPLARRED